MKFETIKKGLLKLIDENVDVADAQQILTEINEIQLRLGEYNDIWKDECYVLSPDTIIGLMNIVTYDEYGKLYVASRKINHQVPFNKYEEVCRYKLELECAPLSVIQVGFDIVRDLYEQNEENGCHYNDGTFKPYISNDKTPMYNLLESIIDIVIAYEATNEGVLTEEDEYNIRLAQSTLKILQKHSEKLDEITVND